MDLREKINCYCAALRAAVDARHADELAGKAWAAAHAEYQRAVVAVDAAVGHRAWKRDAALAELERVELRYCEALVSAEEAGAAAHQANNAHAAANELVIDAAFARVGRARPSWGAEEDARRAHFDDALVLARR